LLAAFLIANDVQGQLPDGWGTLQAFPALVTLKLNDNNLSGTLPGSWGPPSGLQSLFQLELQGNNFSGTIPQAWARSGTTAASPSGAGAATSASGSNSSEGAGGGQFGAQQSLVVVLRPGNTGLCGAVPAGVEAVEAQQQAAPATPDSLGPSSQAAASSGTRVQDLGPCPAGSAGGDVAPEKSQLG
jgi:hypothetical protein